MFGNFRQLHWYVTTGLRLRCNASSVYYCGMSQRSCVSGDLFFRDRVSRSKCDHSRSKCDNSRSKCDHSRSQSFWSISSRAQSPPTGRETARACSLLGTWKSTGFILGNCIAHNEQRVSRDFVYTEQRVSRDLSWVITVYTPNRG